MIEAKIFLKNGKTLHHQFATKRVADVWKACAMLLGQAERNSVEDNQVVWNFEEGKVHIQGYRWFGNRTDSARLKKDARRAKLSTMKGNTE